MADDLFNIPPHEATDCSLVYPMMLQTYPAFWVQDPKAWFDFIELIFRTECVTSQATKFSHAIRSIPFGVLREVKDVFKNVHKVNPYDHLRTEMLKKLASNTNAGEFAAQKRHAASVPPSENQKMLAVLRVLKSSINQLETKLDTSLSHF